MKRGVILDRVLKLDLLDAFAVTTDGGLTWQESRIVAAGPVALYSVLPSGDGWVGVGDPWGTPTSITPPMPVRLGR